MIYNEVRAIITKYSTLERPHYRTTSTRYRNPFSNTSLITLKKKPRKHAVLKK